VGTVEKVFKVTGQRPRSQRNQMSFSGRSFHGDSVASSPTRSCSSMLNDDGDNNNNNNNNKEHGRI